MQRLRKKIFLWIGVAGIIIAVIGTVFWVRFTRHYGSAGIKDIAKDIRAGLAARHVQNPEARVRAFLAARYGPLTDPTNRERAFLGFFNINHIKGLHFIVEHTPAKQKQANTQAMAEWIANYRATMSPAERAYLQTRLDSAAGRAMLRQATAQYSSQDAYFRGNQKPVVAELMKTLASLKHR